MIKNICLKKNINCFNFLDDLKPLQMIYIIKDASTNYLSK